MTGFFIATTIIGLFGSLSRFAPYLLWRDFSYFFRKNKKDYLVFSNKFRGNYYLILGVVSLVLSLASLLSPFKIKGPLLIIPFVVYLLIAESVLQIKWYNVQKDKNS